MRALQSFYCSTSCTVNQNHFLCSGSDFLEALNIRSSVTPAQEALFKPKRGSRSTSLSYRIKQGTVLPKSMQ